MCCMEFGKVWNDHNIFCLHLVARFLFVLEKYLLFLGYGAKWHILNHRYFLIRFRLKRSTLISLLPNSK